jgi:hypothetical protein
VHRPTYKVLLIAGTLALLLTGCVVPVAVSVASYSFSGFSLATTGKDVGDMALSQAVDKNCATWRIIKGDDICREYTAEERHELRLAHAEADNYPSGSHRSNEPDYVAMVPLRSHAEVVAEVERTEPAPLPPAAKPAAPGKPILAGSPLPAALPAIAASPVAPSPNAITAAFFETAATEYLNDASSQYDDWSQKMADLDRGISAKKVTMSAQAKADLDKAWDNIKLRWARLQSANNNDWDSARASWESISKEMRDAWQHQVPQQG